MRTRSYVKTSDFASLGRARLQPCRKAPKEVRALASEASFALHFSLRKWLVAALLASMLAAGLAADSPEQEKEAPVREIRMTAKKYEFTPATIQVKQGERVRLLITALDTTHGIGIKKFGVETDLEKGKQTVVEFVASEAGTFQFKCTNWCGFSHGSMRGTLVVEPAEDKKADKDKSD